MTHANDLESDQDLFCCELSVELDEPAYATALNREIWFLLEYTGPWLAKATADNDLPEAVQMWLDAQIEATLGAGRLQFIKREDSKTSEQITFFAALVDEVDPRLYRFEFTEYEALLELDVAALLGETGRYLSHRQDEPIFLVCTNGRRDRCCALYGLEAYNALLPFAGDSVWQTTHVGGHRFAANVLTFPDGTCYGRLQPEDANPLVRARRRDELYLDRLRGHTGYDGVVQAADYFLRRQSGQHALYAFRHKETLNQEENDYRVQFVENNPEKTVHTVNLHRTRSDLPLLASCGKPQTKPVWQYQLLAYRAGNDQQ